MLLFLEVFLVRSFVLVINNNNNNNNNNVTKFVFFCLKQNYLMRKTRKRISRIRERVHVICALLSNKSTLQVVFHCSNCVLFLLLIVLHIFVMQIYLAFKTVQLITAIKPNHGILFYSWIFRQVHKILQTYRKLFSFSIHSDET